MFVVKTVATEFKCTNKWESGEFKWKCSESKHAKGFGRELGCLP